MNETRSGVDADPPPSGERICGRLEQARCDLIVALVREARPEAFTAESVEIAEYDCPPGGWCSFLASRTFIVVVVPAGCRGSPIAVSVHTFSRLNQVVEYEYVLPAHVAELLPAECAVDPP